MTFERKIFHFFTLLVLVGSFAKAEVFTTAESLTTGKMMIGFEGQANIDPDGARANGHFGYGVNNKWDLLLKAGVGSTNPMMGADLKYFIWKMAVFDLAVTGGAYYLKELFFELIPLATHKFKWLSLSAGAAFNLRTTDSVKLGTNIFGLINLPFHKNLDLRAEAGLKLANYYYNWVSAGVVYHY